MASNTPEGLFQPFVARKSGGRRMEKRESVVHRGWMVKSPPLDSASGLLKTWHMRYFVLVNTTTTGFGTNMASCHHLDYYVQEEDFIKGASPKGRIDVDSVLEIKRHSTKVANFTFTFSLRVVDRTYILCTKTSEEQQQWLEHLHLCRFGTKEMLSLDDEGEDKKFSLRRKLSRKLRKISIQEKSECSDKQDKTEMDKEMKDKLASVSYPTSTTQQVVKVKPRTRSLPGKSPSWAPSSRSPELDMNPRNNEQGAEWRTPHATVSQRRRPLSEDTSLTTKDDWLPIWYSTEHSGVYENIGKCANAVAMAQKSDCKETTEDTYVEIDHEWLALFESLKVQCEEAENKQKENLQEDGIKVDFSQQSTYTTQL